MPVFAQPLSILLLAQETLPAASGAGAGDVAAPQPMGGMSWLGRGHITCSHLL